MSDASGPRLLKAGEFDEVMALLDRYFNYERGGMAARLPFVYDPDRPERHAVITVDGEIVSHVACTPQRLVAGDAAVDCWGIGGVATAKPHRGNGYMGELLAFWLDRMDEVDVPLSDLGGDRRRYGHFGWERAGSEVAFTISERYAPDSAAVEGDGEVRTYEGSDELLDGLCRLHGEHELRVERDRERSRTIYDKRGLETLCYGDDGELRAYLCLSRESRERTIREFGGDSGGVIALLAHLFEHYDLPELRAYAHPEHPLSGTFARYAGRWRVAPSRSLTIRDLPRLVEAYAGRLERKWERAARVAEGEFTLGIEGDPTGVRLSYGPKSLSVETVTGGDVDHALDRRTACRLLFGRGWEVPNHVGDSVLDAVFPLEFYIWPLERV